MVAEAEFREKRSTTELVLPEGEYAYTRDTTSGVTYVRLGPTVVNAQAQDQPVIFDVKGGRFNEIRLTEAAQQNTVVPTGHYAVLTNPAANGLHPEGGKAVAKDLNIGQRVHIPGPTTFALWPRQSTKVIEGHQLRSNQYLLVRVYDEVAARENWAKAVVKKATTSGEAATSEDDTDVVVASHSTPNDLSVGRLLVIRGMEISFYIPPTGVEVVPDKAGNFTRDALTLERLQYCILIDEDGNKRYVRGPDVVFPLPTERFHSSPKGDLHFRPVELNGKIQGIHVKVIADYVDVDGDHGPEGKEYNEGDELFITGKTTPIYFPCEQHSAIKYDGKTKHFATAIPSGDGRYVMARHSGVINMIDGGEQGKVYLPDPRDEVFVRRVLTAGECEAAYPGNHEVLEYNEALRELQIRAPVTRKGVVTAGEIKRSAKMKNLSLGDAEFADVSTYGQAMAEVAGDEFVRKATYTEPRAVTLGNNKFSGVPKINVWTGYAVMLVDTAGQRRVEVGPQRILLGFNETMETLALSTGKPKTTDNLLTTAYLQVEHNKVSDIISAVTSDHVNVSVKVSYRVNFEGDDPTRWFTVSNYVKFLCDHARSVLKASIRATPIEEFFKRSEDFIRDTVLGMKPEDGSQREGMSFENGMRIYDVEVLTVNIGDEQIQHMLAQAQHESVRSSVELAQAQRRLEVQKQHEKIKRDEAEAKALTSEHNAKLGTDEIARRLTMALAELESGVERSKKDLDLQNEQDKVTQAAVEAEISRKRLAADAEISVIQSKEEIRLAALAAEAKITIDRLKAVDKGFSEALLALGNQDTLVKVAEAMSVQQFVGGKNLVEVIGKAFEGSPLASLAGMVQDRAAGSNGKALPKKSTAKQPQA